MADTKEIGELSINQSGSDSNASPGSLRSNTDAERVAFLSSFTPEEDRAIRRKVDWRFLWLIGCMYIIKNVSQDLRVYAGMILTCTD